MQFFIRIFQILIKQYCGFGMMSNEDQFQEKKSNQYQSFLLFWVYLFIYLFIFSFVSLLGKELDGCCEQS